MANKKETAAPNVSVGADTEQPSNVNNHSISNYPPKNNSKVLETVSMAELYDTVYPSKPTLIDGLLYTGTYLFAGAPKLGKSFLMAQIAYHISRGIPLWDYPVRKAAVLYLALEDDYRRLQERLYRMFGTDGADNLFFSVSAGNLGNGMDEQLQEFMKQNYGKSRQSHCLRGLQKFFLRAIKHGKALPQNCVGISVLICKQTPLQEN